VSERDQEARIASPVLLEKRKRIGPQMLYTRIEQKMKL
jgi:hypothetical protein